MKVLNSSREGGQKCSYKAVLSRDIKMLTKHWLSIMKMKLIQQEKG